VPAVTLSSIVAEIDELAYRPGLLSELDDHRWRQLKPHWEALALRINEDKN
jgi:hypothetical protein